jgi:hypothetical protein
MARKGLNPNTESPPAESTRRAELANEGDLAVRDAIRSDAGAAAAALDDTLTLSEADARREVPRLRTDAANPRMDRRLPGPGAERGMLSSNMKKRLNKGKVAWVGELPKTRLDAMRRTMTNRQQLEDVNRSLNGVVGMRSELPSNVRRRVARIDRAIQDFEQKNEGQHIVYTVLKPPREHGNSRNAMLDRLRAMSGNPDARLTFDGYIPATHSLGNISDGPDVVMEIRTRSGAYLGTSDTTPDANHLIGRGRVLRPVSVQDVTYVKPDGDWEMRTVVQMEDVTEDGRTTAIPR